MNSAQFNPNVRNLYKEIINRNIVHNPQFNPDVFPERYENPQRLIGGKRYRENAVYGDDGHFPSVEQVDDNDEGGFYGRSNYNHEIRGGLRKPLSRRPAIGVLKERVRHGLANEMDSNYLPSGEFHGSGRPQRLTNRVKQQILMNHPELQRIHLSGGAINWKKIWENIKKGANVVGKVASNPIVQNLTPEEYKNTLKTTGDVANVVSGMGRRRKGAGFWKDFGHGFAIGAKGANKVASKVLPIASIFQPELAPLAAASYAADKAFGGVRSGGMTQHRKKSVGHAKNQARGALIRQLIRENGMTLGQASSYIKQNNIPF